MGHLAGKDIFQKLGGKIDSLPYRVVKNKALFEILKELYTSEEAELIVKMPLELSAADHIEVLTGISKFGYPNTIVTSSFIADINIDTCEGCGKCAKACPIGAIEIIPSENPESRRRKAPRINTDICIGCGVCSLKCSKTRSAKLIKRKKRVIHPETTFERIILQSLERGTLQHQIFGNPEKITQKVMKGFIGGFLKLPPVKKALMSDKLRSSFLDIMKKGVVKQNKEYLLRF